MPVKYVNACKHFLSRSTHIAPLVTLRIIFGAIMFISTIRFVLNGWVYELYIKPQYFFSYYGFEWIQPFDAPGMYALFALMGISTLFITIGLYYRVFITIFFLAFTYVELIDKTPYLNHYYFISVIAFLMIWVPANRYLSFDVLINPAKKRENIPFWQIFIFQLQLGIVYFYAGMAKVNYTWLVKALPLSIWLKSKVHLPVIGHLFNYEWVYYLFSWFGALYDLTLPLFLWIKKTRFIAYFFVIIFHMMTWYLFPIGMFPFIMIGLTLIFFSESFHIKIITALENMLYKLYGNHIQKLSPTLLNKTPLPQPGSFKLQYVITGILILHFAFQILFPLRYLLYPGNLFWHEQGFRFSWRVMLREKSGIATFYVHNPQTGTKKEIRNNNYLTPFQQQMMRTQPDMMLQYAHYLEEIFQKQGVQNLEITVNSYVNLNGKGSRKFIDPNVDLSNIKRGFAHKSWVIPYSVAGNKRLSVTQ